MQIDRCPFRVVSFDTLEKMHMAGETEAFAVYAQDNAGGIRMRVVDYAPGFLLDHWCDIGHFGYVLSGEVMIELRGKPSQHLKAGEAFLVSTDGDASHRVYTESGVRMLLLD